jgi:hypothetical protein
MRKVPDRTCWQRELLLGVATNRETEHYVAWPERDSCEEAVVDVRDACEAIPPPEFTRLKGTDEVALFVDSSYPRTGPSEVVWWWTWQPGGPPTIAPP